MNEEMARRRGVEEKVNGIGRKEGTWAGGR